MKKSPLVSIIIPTFNRAHLIERAIKSIFEQTYQEFELIIIDDGSTDSTKEVLKKYSVEYHYQENRGVSHARNRGIEKARGEYICFLDSDDEWLPHKLEAQLSFLTSKPEFQWVYSDEIWIRNGKRVNKMKKHQKGGGDQFIPSLDLCLIGASTVMLETRLLKASGGFREDYIVCEDYDLWLRLLLEHEVGYIEDSLIQKYGGHEDQLSTKYFAMDYWRIKTLASLLEIDLSEQRITAVSKIGLKKSDVLIQGYRKHNNLEHLDFIEAQKCLFQEHLQRLP